MSKGWKLTKKGEEVMKEAYSIYEESRDIILADIGFRNFLVVSGTKIEGLSINDYLKKQELTDRGQSDGEKK